MVNTKLVLPMEQIIEEYVNGATLLELQAKYGVSYTSISKRMDAMGIPRRHRGRRSAEETGVLPARASAYVALYAKGYTVSEIARAEGVTSQAVSGALSRQRILKRA